MDHRGQQCGCELWCVYRVHSWISSSGILSFFIFISFYFLHQPVILHSKTVYKHHRFSFSNIVDSNCQSNFIWSQYCSPYLSNLSSSFSCLTSFKRIQFFKIQDLHDNWLMYLVACALSCNVTCDYPEFFKVFLPCDIDSWILQGYCWGETPLLCWCKKHIAVFSLVLHYSVQV